MNHLRIAALRLGRYRPMAVLMLVLQLGACVHTWRPITVSPRQFIEEEQPDRIRVWQKKRATELRNPQIEGDTLTSGVSTEPAQIALTDMTLMEARRVSVGLSFLQWALFSSAVLGVILLQQAQLRASR